MKKILFLIVIITTGFSVKAQLNPTTVPGMKIMTIEESNRLSGTAQPTINGMPYSQYKAQQDALKNKPANKNSALDAKATERSIVNTAGSDLNKPVTPKKTTIMENDQKDATPQAKTTEPVVTKKEESVAFPVIDLSSSSVRQLPANAGSIPSAGDAGKNVLPGMVNGSMPVAEEAKAATEKPKQPKVIAQVKEEAVTNNQTTLPAGIKIEAAPVSKEAQKAVEKPASTGSSDSKPKTVKSEQ